MKYVIYKSELSQTLITTQLNRHLQVCVYKIHIFKTLSFDEKNNSNFHKTTMQKCTHVIYMLKIHIIVLLYPTYVLELYSVFWSVFVYEPCMYLHSMESHIRQVVLLLIFAVTSGQVRGQPLTHPSPITLKVTKCYCENTKDKHQSCCPNLSAAAALHQVLYY